MTFMIHFGITRYEARRFTAVAVNRGTALTTTTAKLSTPQVLLKGFMTSALNPKVTLFFFSIFTVLISPNTPLQTKIGYGFWMASVNALCLIALSSLLTLKQVRQPMQKVGVWLERIMGALLIFLGMRLIFNN